MNDAGTCCCDRPATRTGVLAQPGGGVLHVRLPADVPRDLQPRLRQQRRSTCRGGDGRHVDVLRAGDPGALGDQRLLHARRDERRLRARPGVLKRMRGTPLPPLAFFGGRILQAIGVDVLLVVIVVGVRRRCSTASRCRRDRLPAFIADAGRGRGVRSAPWAWR